MTAPATAAAHVPMVACPHCAGAGLVAPPRLPRRPSMYRLIAVAPLATVLARASAAPRRPRRRRGPCPACRIRSTRRVGVATRLPPDTKEELEEGNGCAKCERERNPPILRPHECCVRDSADNRDAGERGDRMQQPAVVG
jgi:hypothetical protein